MKLMRGSWTKQRSCRHSSQQGVLTLQASGLCVRNCWMHFLTRRVARGEAPARLTPCVGGTGVTLSYTGPKRCPRARSSCTDSRAQSDIQDFATPAMLSITKMHCLCRILGELLHCGEMHKFCCCLSLRSMTRGACIRLTDGNDVLMQNARTSWQWQTLYLRVLQVVAGRCAINMKHNVM